MWTAPSSQGVLQCFDQIACGHISGLSMRSHMSTCHDGFCDTGGIAPVWWVFRTLRGSCRHQNAASQQVEAGATIALPLQQLEAVDLALSLAAAPRLAQGGSDRRAVRLQPGSERRDGRGAARTGIGQPGIQFNDRVGWGAAVLPAGNAAGAYKGREAARQSDDDRSLPVLLDAGGCCCIGGTQGRSRLDQQPRELGHRGQGWCCTACRGQQCFVHLPGAPDVRPGPGRSRPSLDQPSVDLPGSTREALPAQLAPKNEAILRSLRPSVVPDGPGRGRGCWDRCRAGSVRGKSRHGRTGKADPVSFRASLVA